MLGYGRIPSGITVETHRPVDYAAETAGVFGHRPVGALAGIEPDCNLDAPGLTPELPCKAEPRRLTKHLRAIPTSSMVMDH